MNYSDYAKIFLGIKEGGKKHKFIIDTYNKINPLPRNYKMSYTDAWCATFVSFVLNRCNAINPPYECSCFYMWQKCKQNKQTIRAKNAKKDDIVFYDWKNDDTLDHVGFIYATNGDTLTVIEGNKSDSVGYRTINRYNKEIYGYARIKQDIKSNSVYSNDYDNIVNAVIRGDYGNGKERIKKLTAKGYDYNVIQDLVNKKLRGG